MKKIGRNHKKDKGNTQANNTPSADDIRVGLHPPSLFRNPWKWFSARRYEKAHKRFHNENTLFYPTTPMLLEGILKAFYVQNKNNLLEKNAYWEFGVFRGFSFWFAEMVARQHKPSDFYFYGFDSFEGLPKSKVDGSKPAFAGGHYAVSQEFTVKKLKELGVDFTKAKLFKGFYSKELFSKLQKNNTFLPISICTVDVDIYESCVEVLDFIKDYLVAGSIILFDDYNCFFEDDNHGERRALREFEQKNPKFKKEHLFDFGWHGAAFRVKDL